VPGCTRIVSPLKEALIPAWIVEYSSGILMIVARPVEDSIKVKIKMKTIGRFIISSDLTALKKLRTFSLFKVNIQFILILTIAKI
jgi:hypothetical protein